MHANKKKKFCVYNLKSLHFLLVLLCIHNIRQPKSTFPYTCPRILSSKCTQPRIIEELLDLDSSFVQGVPGYVFALFYSRDLRITKLIVEDHRYSVLCFFWGVVELSTLIYNV